MCGQFEVAGGTVTGRMHAEAGRNNQDAFNWLQTKTLTVAVVADGCGSAPFSEIGSRLSALYLTERITHLLEKADIPPDDDLFWRQITAELLLYLDAISQANLFGSQEVFERDYLLATVLGACITPKTTVIFGVGDGVYALNGIINHLGPFPGNAPPYPAYALRVAMGHYYGRAGRGSVWYDLEPIPESSIIKIHQTLPTADVQSLCLGTDGAAEVETHQYRNLPGKAEALGSLTQFWEQDKYFRNPDMIRRRLFLANREYVGADSSGGVIRNPGLLADDTTLVSIRRKI